MFRDSIIQLVYNPLYDSNMSNSKITHPQSENDKIKLVSGIISFCQYEKLSYF